VNLDLTPQKIELVYDDLDTNALNFHLPRPDSFFCIQAGVYLEDDEEEESKLPYFELNEQSNSDCRRIDAVTFFREKIVLSFAADIMFLDRYNSVTLHFGAAVERARTCQAEDSAFPNCKYESVSVPSTAPVDRTLVDFFANHLFLGRYIRYSEDFAESNKVSQTSCRERL
jgi:hypothetical protein